tara:strand:- start:3256 stop:3573 length:318 start_codon:yes stop_codon:yes gene_type:complete
MKKYLQFIDAADDAATYPADNLIAMSLSTDSALVLTFSPGSLGHGQSESHDTVTLAITADREKVVMKTIADEISLGNTPTIVVCDDVDDVFLHSSILSCTITLDA